MSKRSQEGLTFGKWLSAQMTACGFSSNVALAQLIGVNDSTISRWRNDVMVPNMDQLQALEKPLKTPVTQMAVRAGHLTEEQARVRRVAATAPEQPVGRTIDPALADAVDGMTPEQLAEVRRYAEYIRSQNPDAR